VGERRDDDLSNPEDGNENQAFSYRNHVAVGLGAVFRRRYVRTVTGTPALLTTSISTISVRPISIPVRPFRPIVLSTR
jgi:hypothetical protein